jgi:AcrR family transcriptional regulator
MEMAKEKAKTRAERSDGIRSRELILNAAARLATVEGLDGISIGRLAEHIGMSKSGLYAHFGSKEELQLATIDKAEEIFQAEVIEPSMREDPVEMLYLLGDNFISHLERRVFPGGCFFAYTSAELGPRPGAIHTKVAETTAAWTELFVQLLTAAQSAGHIRADEDIEQLAFELDAYLVLANFGYIMSNELEPLERGKQAFHQRLEKATTAA